MIYLNMKTILKLLEINEFGKVVKRSLSKNQLHFYKSNKTIFRKL